MVDKVITMGRTTTTAHLVGMGSPSAPIGSDYREINFLCRFTADAVNAALPGPGDSPHIRVRVVTTAPAHVYQLEIVPPGGNREVLRRQRGGGRVSWARRASVGAGRPQIAQRSMGMVGGGDWEFDDPFGDFIDVGDVTDDPGDPGGGGAGTGSAGSVYTRLLDLGTDERGWWTVRIRNHSFDDQDFTITVDHPETVQNIEETHIPFHLLNRAFAQVLLMMQLHIHVDNGRADIEFDKTFRDLTGIEDFHVSVPDQLQDINLEQFTVRIGNEEGFPTVTAGLDIEDRGTEFEWGPVGIDAEDLAVTCQVQIVFGYPLHDFFLSGMCRANGQIIRPYVSLLTYLDFNPNIRGMWAAFFDWIAHPFGTSIEELIQDFVDTAAARLGLEIQKAQTYVQDVIMHLVNRDHVLYRISADDEGIVVHHHRRPGPRDFIDTGLPDIDVTTRATATSGGASGTPETTNDGPGSPSATLNATMPRDDASPRRVEPVLGLPAATDPRPGLREGQIDHIVILMMENRSFDHMLGYRHFGHPDVNGLTGNESNPFSHGPQAKVYHNSVTAGIRSPAHGHDATLEQLSDGSMSGFVDNYYKRNTSDPRLVMSYYDARELAAYEFLANNFAICDSWYSAHPGATQSNRFVTLTGVTPELDNFELSDDRLGYYTGATVLDYLTQRGVDWVYAEGNIGFIRMFDRYRIDVSHVIPYEQGTDDTEDWFVRRVAEGRLPSVSFIDPRFIDIPPAWNANDDLPPADVLCGQDLVANVYTLLSTAQTWPRTLLLITYDEHGGFYDHEPPPGMPTASNANPFPRVHPDGPTHLGVRVPAFVVSPWVDAGAVFHTTYDHSSILKTILQRFAPADVPVSELFGPRAGAANGLLSEQLRTSARREQPPTVPDITCPPPLGKRLPSADGDDFPLSMRLLGIPAKYRIRTTW